MPKRPPPPTDADAAGRKHPPPPPKKVQTSGGAPPPFPPSNPPSKGGAPPFPPSRSSSRGAPPPFPPPTGLEFDPTTQPVTEPEPFPLASGLELDLQDAESEEELLFRPAQDFIVPPKKEEKPIPKKEGQLTVKSGLIGQILVDNGLLTPGQRDICLSIQADSGNKARFGVIAVEQGFISESDLKRGLSARKSYVRDVREEQSNVLPVPEELAGEAPSAGEDKEQIYRWLSSAHRFGASDLHVMTGKPLTLRVAGKLASSKDPPLDAQAAEKVLTALLSEEDRARLKAKFSVRTCFDLPEGVRVRGSIFRHLGGLNGTFRLIPAEVPSLVALNLPPVLARFTTYAQGLVLVTGPIGSGKTTTLATLLDIVNRERSHHIITVEDPVEFVHENQNSLVTQRQVGLHTNSYANALRAALREDPDVIAVGQMHDLETARLVVTAAETGHLVFATLHTENAVRSINRLIDIFPSEEQAQVRSILSESLRGVISQRLVPRCDAPGRVPVVELVFITVAMRNLIRESKIYQLGNAISISRDIGNMQADDHARTLHQHGFIDDETLNGFVHNGSTKSHAQTG